VGGVVAAIAAFAVSAEVHHYRRFRACEVELEGAVQSGKTFAAFTSDTRPDGLYRRLERPDGAELRQLVDTWPHAPERTADIEAKASRAQTAAVFLFGDMVYVLLFDKQERLREFVLRWQLGVGAEPSNNELQRTRPAQAMEPRR
jgi:hypothetical protein